MYERWSDAERQLSMTPNSNINHRTVIQVPVNIDGREVARSTAEYMGEQQYWEEL